MRDLTDRADVAELVSAFYGAAFEDPLIGPVFTEVAKLDLGHHLPIMCDFWETVLFKAGLYRRNTMQVHLLLHAQHPLDAEHFDRWLRLWCTTVDARFTGPVADQAKVQATRIGGSMQRRLQGRSDSAFETLNHRIDQSGTDVQTVR